MSGSCRCCGEAGRDEVEQLEGEEGGEEGAGELGGPWCGMFIEDPGGGLLWVSSVSR